MPGKPLPAAPEAAKQQQQQPEAAAADDAAAAALAQLPSPPSTQAQLPAAAEPTAEEAEPERVLVAA